MLSGEITQLIWPKTGTSLAIDRKTGQRRVVLAYEILFLFFDKGIVRWDVMNDIFQSLTTCKLIIKQVLPKYSESYIFNWHSKFANCLNWPKVDVLPYPMNERDWFFFSEICLAGRGVVLKILEKLKNSVMCEVSGGWQIVAEEGS